MHIQRLPWAGIRMTTDHAAIVIDPVTRIPERFGGAREPMHPLRTYGEADAVLVTHLHEDHFDPDAIVEAYGADIPVYVPSEMAEAARAKGLTNVIGARVGESFELGSGVKATALPSVDGVGDVQVAWTVEAGERRAIHCGDTLWHGYWWAMAGKYGPFDAAFLPVNGAVLQLPGRLPSGQPICLTPEQAVSAAAILGVGVLVPIHYGTVHYPPVYIETPDIAARLAAASEGKVNVRMLMVGESIALG
ncbi:MBL fold metallo-hydrolase [Paenibacillus methanolicus]|uniref:L-ascorbate metabolism protein UlaG (Beta-lactamase superfamily) n=1 Tax=Paenibacillus methanolicus TaxID=582686 RepID=A0A5S5BR77_9BACL|nr:MBL fold metallo-hydrolase [Paenibacillus methanolicus]TYP69705.1 L-ascorbate metabolism protein UlaG (beta-lactamase superfamily) [Paenibacillus methanolicus]